MRVLVVPRRGKFHAKQSKDNCQCKYERPEAECVSGYATKSWVKLGLLGAHSVPAAEPQAIAHPRNGLTKKHLHCSNATNWLADFEIISRGCLPQQSGEGGSAIIHHTETEKRPESK